MNKISFKLILGILAIVLISSTLSGALYATMYKTYVIEEKTKDLTKRGEQIASFSVTLTDEAVDKNKRQQIINLVEKLTDAKIWVVNENGKIIFDSGEPDTEKNNNLSKDVEDAKTNKVISTQKYSDVFKQSTLSVGVPIAKGKEFKGVVFLHTGIADVYKNYSEYTSYVWKILMLTILLSVLLGVIYSKLFTKNIEKMKKAAIEIAKGNYAARTGVKSRDEFGELARTLDNMAADIERKIKAIEKLEVMSKELVANVSHEFKTPLTIIRGYVENVQDGTIEPSSEVYTKIIKNTKALEKMVNEILDLSKLESGSMELNKEVFELDLLAESIAKEMGIIAKIKNIEVSFEKSMRDNVLINADYDKLKQVLVIFADNAIKYSNDSGKVSIKLDKEYIEINDNGKGIKKEEIEHIFDRFFQTDKSSKKEGYGLGLCIAKRILDMHEYKVEVISEENAGTRVKIIFKPY